MVRSHCICILLLPSSGALYQRADFFCSTAAVSPLLRLLLCGIAVNAISMSRSACSIIWSDDKELRQFSLWMMGTQTHQLDSASACYRTGTPVIFMPFRLARPLDMIWLRRRSALCRSECPPDTAMRVLLISALLTGIAVGNWAGLSGFIGLVILHLMRV